MSQSDLKRLNRRKFALTLAAGSGAAPLLAQQVTPAAQQQVPASQAPTAIPQNTSVPRRRELPPETPSFTEVIEFARNHTAPKLRPFSMTEVRLLPGPFQQAQEANLGYMKRLDNDRLARNFLVNAGLPTSAKPFGGWEAPDCELRGHFTGHFLSACALMYSSTGDQEIKTKGDALVAELAKCQQKLYAGGYLSAFPLEFFDRLNARQKVWAPFYTVHKIMAGMLDMSQHCDNRQALEVVSGMADWADKWSASLPEPHMQDVLNTEYGGMNEVLYNLAVVTSDDRYARVGDRFTKKRFFNPLAAHRDELRGLHVNTHIPQVIGAARRYEISSDERFHDVAAFFWYEVTSSRAYVTGGTSNNEGWLTEPRRLAEELKRGTDTTECCCAYNMLKLTRHLYSWTGDPRYFDYYERALYNHRLGAIDASTGHTQYYLSISPGAWKTFNTEDDSFWCCTGTGVEEFSKLNDSIYFHDGEGVYVNLFIPSDLHWKEKGIGIRQITQFPHSASTSLTITGTGPARLPLHLRIPCWAQSGASVSINGRPVEAISSPGSYLTLMRTWKPGDRIEVSLPMGLRIEAMPDDPSMQAFLYGPLVLAGDLGTEGLTPQLITGPLGPEIRDHPLAVPAFRAAGPDPNSWIRPADKPLTFRTSGQQKDVLLAPFDSIFGRRYSIYWQVS